jgi:tRNA threonylcarbamoyladenosine biosynthesis protein TsaE
MKKDGYISRSPEDTVEFGRRLGYSLRGGDVVLLSGQLGSGKTVLTKGIALGIGIQEVITSPSFTIMNLYAGKLELCHADFYRLDNAAEMEDLLERYLYNESTVTVIEWGEALMDILPLYQHARIEIADDYRVIYGEAKP